MVTAIPLRVKLQVATLAAVAVFGAVNAFIVVRLAYTNLRSEQDQRVSFAGKLLAQRLVEPLAFDDRVAAQKLLDESLTLDASFVAIRLLDSQDRELMRSQSLPPHQAQNRRARRARFPVLNGSLGIVELSVSEESLRQKVDDALRTVLAMVTGILGAGMATAVLLARGISRPVEQLVVFAREFHPERQDPPLPRQRRDELGFLAGELQAMAARLRELHAQALRHAREMERVEHLATVGTLAAGVAHEINNPLAGIRSGLQRLRRRIPEDAQTKLYFETLADALTRIEKAVQGLLHFARATEVSLAPVALAQVVTDARQLVAPCLSGGHIRFTADVPDHLPLVRGDRARLREVLVNLFLNACDAMQGEGELRVWARESGGAVRLWVQDSGPGVPQEVRDKIFMPFFTTKKDKGTGLGLAMARTAMREMGGDLKLLPSSSGACFELTLEPA